MDTKGLFVVGILLFLSIFGLFGVIPVADHNSSVQHNEPTTATVLAIDINERVDDGDREYAPVITYEYTVDGETYTSSNVYPGQFTRWHSSRSTAQSVVEQYQEGSETKVNGEEVLAYYNPDDPSKAYLYNPGWPSGWFLGPAYVIVAFLGGLYLIRKGFRRWRQRQLIQNTPTEQAQSLSIGPSEITGTAVPAEGEGLPAPFSDEQCVVTQYEIKEYDTSGDNSKWKTVDKDVLFQPFLVDDGTGTVLVQPHEDATYDLDPDDWSETYVDSSKKGPDAVQRFVDSSDDVSYPGNASGQSNDRKYRQNLIRCNEGTYVFGTVQPRNSVDISRGATNADRLAIQKVTDDSMREPMFLISDDSPTDLIGRRKWALWRLPAGGLFLVAGFTCALFIFGPLLGIELPRTFDGIITSVS